MRIDSGRGLQRNKKEQEESFLSDTSSKSKKMIAYAGILIINFLAMYLIAGVGVYSYTVAALFDNLPSEIGRASCRDRVSSPV